MKKIFPIVGVLVLVLLVGIFLVRWMTASPFVRAPNIPSSLSPTPTVFVPTEVSFEDYPYVSLTPRADGKEFTLEITGIKNTQTLEYELVYLSQGLSRGVVGSVELDGETSLFRKILLGTCSKNVCRYDEGIEEGTLTIRLRGSGGTKKFTSDFHLQSGGKELISVDGKFKLTGKFPQGNFYIILSTVGLPEKIEGKIIGGPYGVFTSASSAIPKVKVTMESIQEESSGRLYRWDEEIWIEQKKDFETDGKSFSASIDNLGTFILAASR